MPSYHLKVCKLYYSKSVSVLSLVLSASQYTISAEHVTRRDFGVFVQVLLDLVSATEPELHSDKPCEPISQSPQVWSIVHFMGLLSERQGQSDNAPTYHSEEIAVAQNLVQIMHPYILPGTAMWLEIGWLSLV